MRILALDTATRSTVVAAVDDEAGLRLERRDDPEPGSRPRHTTRLLAMASDVLAGAGWRWDQVDRLAVGVGPGSFTGLRVGLATARALAWSLQIPLVGVSTLASVALNAEGETSPRAEAATILAALDARRREVFAAAWPLPANPVQLLAKPLLAPAAMSPAALAQAVASLPGPVLALGDGSVEFREILERSGALVPEDGAERHLVTAINHCRLARSLTPSDPEEVKPEYLRLPDAELVRRAAGNQ